MTEDYIQHRKRESHASYISHGNTAEQQRLGSFRKKNESLSCSICGGAAHGYNFDAITCESCKAFFRRNALKPPGEFKCRTNNHRCIITVATRKRCKACRLTKCLEQGMRADWILTDQERLNKRKKIEENRRLRQLLYPELSDADEMELVKPKSEPYEHDDEHSTSSSYHSSIKPLLSSEDLCKIDQIRHAYQSAVHLISLPSQIPTYPQLVRINEVSDIMNFPVTIQATRLITYFKLLPEFSSLNENDKLILTKFNTLALVFIRAALTYNPSNDTYHEPNTDECGFAGSDLILCFGPRQYENSTQFVRKLIQISHNDRFILEILLIILLFSKGSSICTFKDGTEPIAQDILTIFHKQNLFIDLLWKYCEDKYGHYNTVKIWLKLTMSSMYANLQSYQTRHHYVKFDPVANHLSPLIKSVMLLA